MKLLDFPSAVKAVINGKRITKQEWDSTDHYGVLIDGYLCLHKKGEPEDENHQWLVSEGDMRGLDYFVL